MEKGIIIVIAFIGILIVNLINRNKPAFQIGGTIIITAGCLLGLLFYFRISYLADVRTIVLTLVLSAALLLLAYFLVLFAVNYARSKQSMKKREMGKRKETASVSVKKLKKKEDVDEYKRKLASIRGEEAEVEEEQQVLMRKSSGKKRMKHDDKFTVPASEIKASETEPIEEVQEDEWIRETKVGGQKIRKRGTAKLPTIDPEELESAEEWKPDTVSADERKEYLTQQYAWMDEQVEDEVNLAVVFAGAGEEEQEPQRASRFEQEAPETEEAPVFSNFVALDMDDAEDIRFEAEEEPAAQKDEWIESDMEIEQEILAEEPEIEVLEEESGYDEFEFAEKHSDIFEKEEIEEEPAEEIEEAAVFDEEEWVTSEEEDREAEEPAVFEEEAEELAAFEDEAEEAAVFEEEAGEPAAFEEEAEEPVVFEEEAEEPVVFEEEVEEPAIEEEPEIVDPAAEKNAELAALRQLIAQKDYDESLKKVFAILNKGYVMTPDEKQQMKIIMLMLKEKT